MPRSSHPLSDCHVFRSHWLNRICLLACMFALAGCQKAVSGHTQLSEGDAFPLISLTTGTGAHVGVESMRGRMVVLNIWATWCSPCRKEMPALDRLQQKLGGADFQVVALSIDGGGTAAVRGFYDEIGIRTLAIYVDPTTEATGKLRTVGIPTTLLLDREGRERWRKTGPAEWDSPEIVESLRAKLRGGAS